jgi:hypothetical protein
VLVTRQVATTLSIGGTTNVNVEQPGSHRLPTRTVMDLRIFRNFTFGSRSVDFAVDFNNIANANTVWSARSLSGTIGLRQNGDPNGALNTLPQFLSPAEVYPPRNIRFNVAFRF